MVKLSQTILKRYLNTMGRSQKCLLISLWEAENNSMTSKQMHNWRETGVFHVGEAIPRLCANGFATKVRDENGKIINYILTDIGKELAAAYTHAYRQYDQQFKYKNGDCVRAVSGMHVGKILIVTGRRVLGKPYDCYCGKGKLAYDVAPLGEEKHRWSWSRINEPEIEIYNGD